jgi:hypothetical protein
MVLKLILIFLKKNLSLLSPYRKRDSSTQMVGLRYSTIDSDRDRVAKVPRFLASANKVGQLQSPLYLAISKEIGSI